MSKGFHKCEHCNEWHDCNRPSGAGCVGALVILLLAMMLMPLILDYIKTIGCSSGYSWAQPVQGCDSSDLIINDNLEKRVKALEEKAAK